MWQVEERGRVRTVRAAGVVTHHAEPERLEERGVSRGEGRVERQGGAREARQQLCRQQLGQGELWRGGGARGCSSCGVQYMEHRKVTSQAAARVRANTLTRAHARAPTWYREVMLVCMDPRPNTTSSWMRAQGDAAAAALLAGAFVPQGAASQPPLAAHVPPSAASVPPLPWVQHAVLVPACAGLPPPHSGLAPPVVPRPWHSSARELPTWQSCASWPASPAASTPPCSLPPRALAWSPGAAGCSGAGPVPLHGCGGSRLRCGTAAAKARCRLAYMALCRTSDLRARESVMWGLQPQRGGL